MASSLAIGPRLAAFGVVAGLTLWSAPIHAQAPALAAATEGDLRALSDGATLRADQATMVGLLAATQTGGFALIATRLGDLRAIMARAPKSFHPVEEHSGVVYVRSMACKSVSSLRPPP